MIQDTLKAHYTQDAKASLSRIIMDLVALGEGNPNRSLDGQGFHNAPPPPNAPQTTQSVSSTAVGRYSSNIMSHDDFNELDLKTLFLDGDARIDSGYSHQAYRWRSPGLDKERPCVAHTLDAIRLHLCQVPPIRFCECNIPEGLGGRVDP